MESFAVNGVTLRFLQLVREYVSNTNKNWTTTDVFDNVVKPLTQSSQCSFVEAVCSGNTAPSMDPVLSQLFMTLNVSKADCFGDQSNVYVAHAWMYNFMDMVAALESYASDYRTKFTKATNVVFWLDTFVDNKWKCHGMVPSYKFLEEVLPQELKKIGNACLVFMPWESPIPLSRTWCLFEIWLAKITGTPLTIQLSKKQQLAFEKKILANYHDCVEHLTLIDIRNSESISSADKDRLLGVIEQSEGSFAGANAHITQELKEWFRSYAVAALHKQEDGTDMPVEHKHMLARSYSQMGSMLLDQGHLNDAEEMYRSALVEREKVLGAEDPFTLESVNSLAVCMYSNGELVESEALQRRAIAGYEKTLGVDHQSTLMSYNNLANIYKAKAQYTDAELLFRKALAGYTRVLGEDHADTFTSMNNLANLLRTEDKLAEAELLCRKALAGREKLLGPEDLDTLLSVLNLANLLSHMQKLDEAEAMYRRALFGRSSRLGADHPDTLRCVHNLARLLHDSGKTEEAEEKYRRAYYGRGKALGMEHLDTLDSANSLGVLLMELHKEEEAEDLYLRAMMGREQLLGWDHSLTCDVAHNLGTLYKATGRCFKASKMFDSAYKGYRASLGDQHPKTVDALAKRESMIFYLHLYNCCTIA